MAGSLQKVRFTKMEGLGNDYIYINNMEEKLPEERFADLSIAVAERHFGIGSDGLIVI
ncbi:MAG TPA: diaminopimelate epimerase, partial [Symbiobacteriaceae bacterium]|nr:diaminopimelate epimerase [Symbiobacteriaceae bacterium]